jgi:zinc protease
MTVGRALLAGLAAALFASAAPAADVKVAGAAAVADVKVLPAPKGQEVWYVSDHTLPMIAMSAALPAGSAYDPQGKFGLAAFAADLLDEGAGTLNATAFQTALSNRAIRLNISPGRDYLVITLVTLTDNAKDAFQLLGLALSHPRFDPDAVQRVRAQMISGLEQEDEDPPTVAAKAFYRAFFHDHPYGHPVSGDAQSLSGITQADIKGFAASHWVRGDLKIAVSGDVDPATLTQLLNSAFGHLPARTPAPPPWPGHVGTPGVQVIPMPVPQPSVAFGLPGLMRSDRDFVPGFVANYIVGGGGFSSRLTDEVRVKRGLTYDIDTSLETFRRAGIMAGEFATKQGSVNDAIGVVRDTLKDFAENGPTDKELADAKTYLTGSFPLSFSSNVGIVGELNGFQQVGLPIDYVQKRNALIEAVTVADVKRAARRIFGPRGLTIVIAGTPGAAQPAKPAAPAESHAAHH